MTLRNASFEEPGVNPGQADQWSEGYDVGASDVADFTHYDFYTRPFDDFEQSWGNNHLAQTSLGLTDKVAALFELDSVQFESFESSWREPATGVGPGNQIAMLYYYEGFYTTALFNGGADEEEDFETQWGTTPFNEASIDSYGAGSWTTALFDSVTPETKEDFEEEWKDCEDAYPGSSFLTLFALFDTGFENAEDFEEEWTETLPT